MISPSFPLKHITDPKYLTKVIKSCLQQQDKQPVWFPQSLNVNITESFKDDKTELRLNKQEVGQPAR